VRRRRGRVGQDSQPGQELPKRGDCSRWQQAALSSPGMARWPPPGRNTSWRRACLPEGARAQEGKRNHWGAATPAGWPAPAHRRRRDPGSSSQCIRLRRLAPQRAWRTVGKRGKAAAVRGLGSTGEADGRLLVTPAPGRGPPAGAGSAPHCAVAHRDRGLAGKGRKRRCRPLHRKGLQGLRAPGRERPPWAGASGPAKIQRGGGQGRLAGPL